MQYDESVLDLFNNPEHCFSQQHLFENVLSGFAGDFKIGEQVYLYFDVVNERNKFSSKIKQAKFSVMGNVMLIAAAEQLCRLAEGKTLGEVLSLCNVGGQFYETLKTPQNRLHSVEFVVQAFHHAVSKL